MSRTRIEPGTPGGGPRPAVWLVELLGRIGRDERGGALIITVLIGLAMTGLALVAVTSVNLEMRLAQNQKQVKQAQYIAETGMLLAIQRIQAMGSSSLVRQRGRQISQAPEAKIQIPLSSFGPNGVFDTENQPERSMYTLGAEGLGIDFLVEVESMTSTASVPGFQLNLPQETTYMEVSLLSRGRVGRQVGEEGVDPTTSQVGFSERQIWALVPVP